MSHKHMTRHSRFYLGGFAIHTSFNYDICIIYHICMYDIHTSFSFLKILNRSFLCLGIYRKARNGQQSEEDGLLLLQRARAISHFLASCFSLLPCLFFQYVKCCSEYLINREESQIMDNFT